MLRQLYIRNFTLIDELNISFEPGFSVITGETGAGKSIILGALGLLLGHRADSKQVKRPEEKCIIEAHFDLTRYELEPFFRDNDIDYDAADCILRREVTSAGKSRAFINDTPTPLTLLRDLGEQLVDIHSQHQNLLLQKEDFQLQVVDIMAQDKQERDSYLSVYHDYRHQLRALQQLQADGEKNKAEEDYLRFQLKELQDAQLQPDEQEQLEAESQTIAHAVEIETALHEADQLLSDENGIVDQARKASSRLADITEVYPEVKELAQRMDEAYIELKDIAEEIGGNISNLDFDPAYSRQVTERLDTIYALEKKFHANTIGELIAQQKQLEEKLDHIDNYDAECQELERLTTKLKEQCTQLAATLSKRRQRAIPEIEQAIRQRLAAMGIPNVQLKIDLTPTEQLSEKGQDQVVFLFSANKNMPLRPLTEVASGGEIARVMLSLKAMISQAVRLPTIIFDEIDTGVSGKVARQMALIMHEMGQHDRQVISITHLPQIAALGTTHYKVYKEDTTAGTVSHMRQLDHEERVTEIAQMLSGNDITAAAISNAKELLATP